MLLPFDEIFDMNNNGQLDAMERGMEFMFMEELSREDKEKKEKKNEKKRENSGR